MSQLGNINATLMIKFLEDNSFYQSRQKGSQFFFRHLDGRTATVPVHKGEDLGKGIVASILRDIGIDKEVFLKWLGR